MPKNIFDAKNELLRLGRVTLQIPAQEDTLKALSVLQYKPTRGEAVSDLQPIANGAALTIRPAVGETWVIEFLGFSGAVTIAFTDGTNSDTITTETGEGVIEKASYTITRGHYITMSNASGGALIYSYAGFKVNENI